MARLTAIFWAGIILLGLLGGIATAKERQIVAGAGPSEEICKLFFAKFNELEGVEDYLFFVMEGSIKHKGGILNSDKYLFGRTGRPLTEEEKALGKNEIFLGQVPIAFVKGLEVNVSKLTMEQIEKIFTGQIKNWQDVGGPDAEILLVGREPTEALFLALKEEYPFFKKVQFEKTFNKDDEVIQFLSSPYGRHAIAFGAKPNFMQINLLSVADFSTGVKMGLVYDVENQDKPIIKLAESYAASPEWKEVVDGTSMLRVK